MRQVRYPGSAASATKAWGGAGNRLYLGSKRARSASKPTRKVEGFVLYLFGEGGGRSGQCRSQIYTISGSRRHPGGRCCSSPSPSTVRIIQYIKNAQKLCPVGVWAPRLHNKSEKNVWGLRLHTFSSLLLRNVGPQTPPPDTMLRICCSSYYTQMEKRPVKP